MMRRGLTTLLLMLLGALPTMAQFTDSGLNFQAVLYNEDSSAYLVNTPLDIRFTFYNANDVNEIYWQEEHITSTSDRAVFNVLIGRGISTGAGTYATFDDVELGGDSVNLKVELDIEQSGYVLFEDGRLWAVPYAYHSETVEPIEVNFDLADVDTNGLAANMVLEWDGTMWVGNYILSAQYADTAGTSVWSDTVNFAYTAISLNVDSAEYAFYADSVLYAPVAGYVESADTAGYVDTAGYAYAIRGWHLDGDSADASHFVGSTNAQPFIAVTDGTERFRLEETGQFHIGVTDSLPELYVDQVKALLIKGIIDSGVHVDASGPNPALYWSARKGGLVMGTMSDTMWNENSLSLYSFAFGRNCWVGPDAHYGMAFGDSSWVNTIPASGSLSNGLHGLAIGYHCRSAGAYGLAVGYECEALIARSTALGYRSKCISGYAAVAIGNNVIAHGNLSPCFGIGSNLYLWHKFTSALGHNVRINHEGSFGIGDFSTVDTLFSTAGNQFIIRAAGGVNLYSNSSLTSGVSLASGGGSWLTVSDETKKENFLVEPKARFRNSLLGVGVYAWNYKSQNGVRHIGPTAQGMFGLFGYGESNLTITTTDIDGVVMYGVILLSEELKLLNEKNAAVTEISTEVDYSDLEERLLNLEEDMNALQEN
jgi:hypothetical protein